MSTAIPYLDEVWNVTTGCGDDMASPGCLNCYARRMFGRNLWKCPACAGRGRPIDDEGHVIGIYECHDCYGTGKATFAPTFHANRLDQPLHWRKPMVVGVSFMGDLFHEGITLGEIASVLDVAWRSHEARLGHTFLMLTKRPQRMHDLDFECPPNLWLGVTVCNQEEWGRNVPTLKATPAAHRWVSYEPALGPLVTNGGTVWPDLGGIDWMVCGGETGPGARPMQPEWALDVFRQCKGAGVPFWFKSMGTAPHKKVWDWPDTLGAEMQATHEMPVVKP